MPSDTSIVLTDLSSDHPGTEHSPSAVSWAAIFSGAFVAAGVSLILVALGAGFGLATPSLASFTVMTGVWLIVTQWVASGVGGYLTGRLRVRWTSLHSHEVFFRDTAHGFVTWSVATVAVAALALAGAVLPGGQERNGASAHQTAGVAGYQVDWLFRSALVDETHSAEAIHAEAERLLARGLVNGGLSVDDRGYLATVVSSRTGVTLDQAKNRVDATMVNLRQAADIARKTAAKASIVTAIAMLIGALIACVAAALGGQQRDEHA